jgi:LPS export ABC transporter protein LptC
MLFLRRMLRFLSALIFFFTVWFLWPREVGGLIIPHGANNVPDYRMTNAHYISVKEGQVEMETHAEDAQFDIARHRMDAQHIIAFLYNSQHERTIMTADHANFFMDERRLFAHDNVQSLSSDGFLLRTTQATYLVNKRLVEAPEPVEGETLTRDLLVWGNSAEAPLEKRELFLKGNARAQYNQKGQKHGLTNIRGDSATVDRNEASATFLGNVEAKQEDFTGTGERGELFFSQEEHGVKYMSLHKDVKITQVGGRYTRSQEAEFFAPSDTIVLTGFPAVYNGDDAVTGDKITMYRTTGVVEVTATNAATSQGRKGGSLPTGPRPLTKEDEELIP